MAGEVVERIKGRVGIPWMTETVDRIVAGSPDAAASEAPPITSERRVIDMYTILPKKQHHA
jgi:hypothetical protein